MNSDTHVVTVEVSTQIDIARPLAVVRAQFADIDHHIRNNIHGGVTYRWLAANEQKDDGHQRFVTEQQVLGLGQTDTWWLEDLADGSLLRASDPALGSGAKLLYKFVALGEAGDKTRVILEAKHPVSLLRRLLGPLWKIGLRKLLERQLDEDRRDLEGEYRQGAAGNLDAALGLLAGTDAKVFANPEVGRTIITAASLAAVADGSTDGAERALIEKLLPAIGCRDIDMAWVERAFEETLALSQTEAMGHVAGLVGQQLQRLGVGREGLIAAALVAQVSRGVALAELAVLERLAHTAGLDEKQVQDILVEVDAALDA